MRMIEFPHCIYLIECQFLIPFCAVENFCHSAERRFQVLNLAKVSRRIPTNVSQEFVLEEDACGFASDELAQANVGFFV